MNSEIRMAPRRAANVRTAMILLAIAVVFFCGIIAAQYSDAPEIAIGVLGLAILGFLGVSIGRNVGRSGRR
jgi:hypothetical protein